MDANLFKEPQNDVPIVKNYFDLGNHSVTTIRGGELVPIFHQKVIPNTPFETIRANLYGRFLTLLNPIMDEFDLFVYHFFVPTRIIFPQFDRFKAGQKKAELDGTAYDPLPPRASMYTIALQSSYGWMQNALQNSPIDPFVQLDYIGWWTNSLTDYLNFPSTNEIAFAVDPFNAGNVTAVQLIDNPLYLDSTDTASYFSTNIYKGETERKVYSYFAPHNLDAEENLESNYSTRRLLIEPYIGYTLIWYDYFRNWRLEDYKYSPYDFISEVSEKRNNDYTYNLYNFFDETNDCLNFFKVRKRDYVNDMFISSYPRPQLGDAVNIPYFSDFSLIGQDVNPQNYGSLVLGNQGVVQDFNGNAIRFDFSTNPPTIDDLHKAEQAQKYLQLLMVHGIQSRDIDKMLYGATSTLPFDNPVYLGGEKLTFRFDEVIQTSSSTEDQPLGDFAGRGYVSGSSSIDNFTAEEYGYYFCLVCAVPHCSYYQGMPREYTRYFDYMELPNPLFANLGFDNIKQEEIMFHLPIQNSPISSPVANMYNNTDFGYQTRYIDQRSHNNEIHGSFRSSLLNWHVARQFKTNVPVSLNKKFTAADYRSFERIFAIQQYTYPNLLVECKFDFKVVQPLSYYCNPSV